MCSFDARNRGSTGLPLKMKWEEWVTRAVEDQSAPIPKEITSELGWITLATLSETAGVAALDLLVSLKVDLGTEHNWRVMHP